MEEATINILLGVTGSVATIKTSNIIQELKSRLPTNKVNICLVPTAKALHFLPDNLPDDLQGCDQVHLDAEEWSAWQGRGDPVLHIELRKWAHILVVAPLDANTLAKMSNGLADNLLTCIARAWDFNKPCLFAPAMNTLMWEHPVTSGQVDKLKEWGYTEIPCIEKVLMCKDKGQGAMAEPETIAEYVVKAFNHNKLVVIEPPEMKKLKSV
jgi:phosphopantothenoylcysteine decarboxylase